jgi:hypothetical protein
VGLDHTDHDIHRPSLRSLRAATNMAKVLPTPAEDPK